MVRVTLLDQALTIGAGPGRGAWLCAGRTDCFDAAARRGAFERALRAPVGPNAIEALGRSLSERSSLS